MWWGVGQRALGRQLEGLQSRRRRVEGHGDVEELGLQRRRALGEGRAGLECLLPLAVSSLSSVFLSRFCALRVRASLFRLAESFS